MPDSLSALEGQRFQILRQFASLGDLRPGSICAVSRRCGKPTCHCAKPNDPGHSPQLRLTRKIDGQNGSRILSLSRCLSQSPSRGPRVPTIAELMLRPGPGQRKDLPPAATPVREVERGGKKTTVAVHQEITREIDALLPRIFAEQRKSGGLDTEAVEFAFRTALHAAGAAGLSQLLREPGPVQTSVSCPCGGKARYQGHAARTYSYDTGSRPSSPRLLLVLPLSARAVPRRYRP